MTDQLTKFASAEALSVGSNNPVAAMMAMAMLQEMNGHSLTVAKAQTAEIQNVGTKMGNSGIQLG